MFQSNVLKILLSKIAYAYTYVAHNLCVGVIFDNEQDDRKVFSKFELFGFLGIRFETNLSLRTKVPFVPIFEWPFLMSGM